VSCEEHLAAFCAGLDGSASRSERAEARRHVAGCASCRAESERLAELHELLEAERRRRADWLGGPAEPARPPAGLSWLAPTLVAAAAALFATGLSLEKPWRELPRLAVLAGDAAVDGRPAHSGQRLPVGTAVTVGQRGSATVHYSDGSWLRIEEQSELLVAGEVRGRRCLQLGFGRVLVEIPADARPVVIASDLGGVRAAGAVFELSVSPIYTGAARATPSSLRLAVARGKADLEQAGTGNRWAIPAGLSARSILGTSSIETPQPLLAAEWQRMLKLDAAPAFADNTLAAEKVPPGVWVPRWPGRNGPTPGSHAGARMVVSRELAGCVLSGGRFTDGGWCYDARADRWRSLTGSQVRPPEAGDGPKAPGTPQPPAGHQGTAMAYSPKADAVLLFGGGDRAGSETWVYRPREGRWQQLAPANNPPPRKRHALCYDPAADLFVTCGGEGPGGTLDDVWVFRLGP
jgi:hypothetical protein